MRLTRRGWAVVAVVALTYLAAWAAGDRALNAVAAPLLAALAAGGILVWRADDPTFSYGSLRAGFPDDQRTLTVEVNGSGIVTVEQSLPDGIEADAIDATVTPPHEFERTVTLARRGVYQLDPPAVHQRDPLGLVSRSVTVEPSCEFVVYPQVYDVDGKRTTRLFADDHAAERQEFDRLREYVPGDPLRNVHWKSSAKRDDFLVMEFAPTQRTETVTIVADAAMGYGDEMAAAAATFAVGALDADLKVELTLPEAYLSAGKGDAHRGDLLRLLASTSTGRIPSEIHGEANVSIHANEDGTQVRFGDRTEQFERLRTASQSSEVGA